MSPDRAVEVENKALVRRWFDEVWNQGRTELIDELRAPDVVAIGLGDGSTESHGVTPFKIFYSNLRQAFPDLHITIEDILAEGDKVAVRITIEGTHLGNAWGTAPTGRKVTFSGIVIACIAEGKIAQAWNNLDQLGILKQIGALPEGGVRDNFLTTQH